MTLGRLLRHTLAGHWRTRLAFKKSTLDAIEEAIGRAERTHAGEIRFVIEGALAPLALWHGIKPRDRALQVFASQGVWDTENNNGVLIYLLAADRSVEIVADRGLTGRVSAAEWQGVCRLMEEHFRSGRYETGSIAGVDAIGNLLSRHFPQPAGAVANSLNQLPDRPTLL